MPFRPSNTMPIQSPAWNDFLSCPVCCQKFNSTNKPPISLGCGHTLCATCLHKLHTNNCPFDQTQTTVKLTELPVNHAILSLINEGRWRNNFQVVQPSSTNCIAFFNKTIQVPSCLPPAQSSNYLQALTAVCKLAFFLRPCTGLPNLNVGNSSGVLSRSMQRKLITLISCQLIEVEGRSRAMRAARSLGERAVNELLLHHQNHHQLSATLWAAVRARGCQFLGPAMQEEVIRLVLLALEDGSALSRKVLVMFVVQRLEPQFPQASKTSIGHVVQLLYRASCFKVSKREHDSSLMQLKEEFRCYESLRREHDTQIVQIALEAGLRIAPDQWSSLLYGDVAHKSHMQSIMDKLQTPQSFAQSVKELFFVLHRTGDPGRLHNIYPHLEFLASLDPGGGLTSSPIASACDSSVGSVSNVTENSSQGTADKNSVSKDDGEENNLADDLVNNGDCSGDNDNLECSWDSCTHALTSVNEVLAGLVHFLEHFGGSRRIQDSYHQNRALGKFRIGPRVAVKPFGAPFSKFEEDNRMRSRNNFAQLQTPIASKDAEKVKSNGSKPVHPSNFSPTDDCLNTGTSFDQAPENHHSKVTTEESSLLSQQSCVSQPTAVTSFNPANDRVYHFTEREADKLFESAKMSEVIGQQSPYMYAQTPGSILTIAPPSFPPQFVHASAPVGVFTAAEIAPSPYAGFPPTPSQTPAMFSSPVNVPSTPPYPQAATPIIATPDLYSPAAAGAAPAMIINPVGPLNSVTTVPLPAPVYNVMPHTLELVYPVSAKPPLHQPQSLIPPPVIPQPPVAAAPWYEFPAVGTASDVLPRVASPTPVLAVETSTVTASSLNSKPGTSGARHLSHCSNAVANPTSIEPLLLKKKSLSELEEIKENLVTRLRTIVGKKEVEEVQERIAKNQEHVMCVFPEPASLSSSSVAYTLTYSIWTSGATFSSMARTIAEKDKLSSSADSELTQEASGGLISSQLDAVKSSSVPRPIQVAPRTARPIQVSASNSVGSTTTSTMGTNYPVVSLSSMPTSAVLYPTTYEKSLSMRGLYNPIATAGGSLNTIDHGIIDPPHLHMSQLNPSGTRPSDPIDNKLLVAEAAGTKEDRQRQQLNAVKDGIDPFNAVKAMPEKERLKQELSFVMHGIQEKLNVQQRSGQLKKQETTHNDIPESRPDWVGKNDEWEESWGEQAATDWHKQDLAQSSA